MSANDKFGLGYEDYRYGSILSYENEVLQSVFTNKESDLEDTSINDRYVAGMHAVPLFMTGNYMPSKPSEYVSYESDSSIKTTTSMPNLAKNAPKVVCEPKLWTDAPIIEEYKSDSDYDSMSSLQEDKEKPSFAFTDSVQHVETSRENGGSVAFGGSNGRITGKGKIKAGKLDIDAFNDCELSYPDDPSMPHLEDIYASPSEGIFIESSYDDEVQPQPKAAEEEDDVETCATLSQKVAQLEQDKIAQALEILKLKKSVKKLEKKRRSKSSGLKKLRKVGTSQRVESSTETIVGAQLDRRIDDVSVAAANEVNAVEPTMLDDEEVTMTMAQTLIKMKAKKERLFDEQMTKRLHDDEVEQAAAKEKQQKDDLEKAKVLQKKKYQSLKRKPISIAQARKNMMIYLKNMARYKMEHFRGTGYDNQRIGNVAEARETVGTTVVQKSGIQCYNFKEFRHVARECQKPKRVKDATYHKEKMLLCK
nr:hypothetical protein [Tanacetum cinerariifolium]